MLKSLKNKQNTAYFKSISREQVDIINANRTNPPPVGHYRPDVGSIYVKERSIFIPDEHIIIEKKKKQKPLCEHLKKNLNPVM